MNSKKRFFLFLCFIIICLIISILSGYFGLNQNSIERFVNLNHNFASLIYTVLFIILASFAFSVSVMTTIGAMFFTSYEVIIFAMIGIMGSSIIDFYISRKLGRNYARTYVEKKGGNLEIFERILEKNPSKTIFLLSAIFFVPPTIPNFLGGIIKINLKRYCIATFFGNILNTVFTVLLMNSILYSNTLLFSISITSLILITLISLYFYSGEIKDILYISFPWFFRKR